MNDSSISDDTGVYVGRNIDKLTDKVPTKGSRKDLINNHLISTLIGDAANFLDSDEKSTLVYIHTLLNINNIACDRENEVRFPQWRRLTDRNKTFLRHLALQSMAERESGRKVVPFTLNLTPNVIDKSKAITKAGTGSFPGYLQERLKTNLRRKLGRPVEFFLGPEVAVKGPKGRLHIHGEILLTGEEIKNMKKRTGWQPVREAFHMINDYSDSSNFKQFAVKFEFNRCDLGWVNYMVKCKTLSGLYFNGKPIAATTKCTQQAKVIWDQIRGLAAQVS
jgi:hypothetical protein